MVIAHQVGYDIALGSTMFAFQNAVDLSVDALEMDLHISKDNTLVLIHTKETMRKFISWSIDGIMTERPDIMLEILGR